MNKYLDTNLRRFTYELRYVDEISQVVLKGHLLIEEALTRIIAKFVFHSDIIPSLRMGFALKMDLARSMSLDESENRMWKLIAGINELRNQLSHSLDTEKRTLKVEKLRQIYLEVCKSELEIEDVKKAEDSLVVIYAFAQSLGFLGTFEGEIDRFRDVINELDKVRNLYRYQQGKNNGA